ncbi:hypothetical protein K6H10_002052 [Candida tropicalis]
MILTKYLMMTNCLPLDESSYLLGEESNDTNGTKKPKAQSSSLSTAEHTISRRKSTLDEEREQFTDYTYPGLIDPLDGPWIGFTGNFVSMIEYKPQLQQVLEEGRNNDEIAIVDINEQDLVVNKKLKVSEWE